MGGGQAFEVDQKVEVYSGENRKVGAMFLSEPKSF